MHYIDKNKLFELLAQGAALITPNNRLVNALLRQFFEYSHKKTLNKPHCLPYSSFLIQTYRQLQYYSPHEPHPILLNSFQCQHLWRNLIKENPSITYSEGLLNSVMQAWEHSEKWHVDSQIDSFNYTLQTKQFQTWCQLFDSKLRTLHAITEHQLIPYFLQKDFRQFDATSVIWVCFDDFHPQQVQLQQHLQKHNIPLYKYELVENTCLPQVYAANDIAQEYEQLTFWLEEKIEQGQQRIGVVIPDLQQKWPALQKLLLQQFDSELFNISLGKALNAFPLVAHALVWLGLNTESLTTHQAALLLHSPYIGNAQKEFLARTEYLHNNPLLQNATIPFKAFIASLRIYCPLLAEKLEQLKAYPHKASIPAWINHFQNRLNDLGFPGDYGLDSQNYQCFNRFVQTFDEFRQLALLSDKFTTKEALHALKHIAEYTVFQIQTKETRVQISGLLEASGCEFDSLWVMGLTDQCLPQKTHLSAFIPPQIQRELLMPHSVPSRELQFAKQILQRLQRGSKSLVFSYAKLQADTPSLPCSLILHFPARNKISGMEKAMKSASLITEEEDYHIPLKSEESISGGTSLLANQAKCPFKAFAEHRLYAKASLRAVEGLNNLEKGQIIHKIMELIWKNLQSQSQLLQLTTPALDELIERCIKVALEPVKLSRPHLFSVLFQEVEYLRLKRLVLASLEWEKQRPPFTITALEQAYTISLAGLDFKVRVDRLDEVHESKWVIDYKSTLPDSRPWDEERPKDPQLLLYALLDIHINTLLLIQLKAGRIQCKGISEEEHNIADLAPLKKESTWKEYREKWQQQLTVLAEEIKQGFCLPDPINPGICSQCDFKNLCRYNAALE